MRKEEVEATAFEGIDEMGWDGMGWGEGENLTPRWMDQLLLLLLLLAGGECLMDRHRFLDR